MVRIHVAGIAICLSILALSPNGFAAEPRDSGVTSPLESLPESIWQAGLDSTARHVQTGLACPFEVNGFTLQNVMTFDAVGLDVGCNYLASAGNAVTVYLTKRGQQSLQDDLARADMELQYTYNDAEPLTDEAPHLSGDIAFLSSLYLLPQHGAHSGIWVADYSGWTLKLRATYPAGNPVDTTEALAAILANAGAARTHLALCATEPMPERSGQPIDDLSKAAVVGTLGLVGHFAPSDEPRPEPVWCAEEALPSTRLPLLLWRNVGEPHASRAVTKISLSTEGPPPAVEVVASGFASIPLNEGIEEEALSVVAHVVLAAFDGTPGAFAFYAGAPSSELLTPLAERIFSGEMGPSVYVNDEGTVMISFPEEN